MVCIYLQVIRDTAVSTYMIIHVDINIDICWGCLTFSQHGTLLSSNKTGSILDIAQTIEVGRSPRANKLSPLSVKNLLFALNKGDATSQRWSFPFGKVLVLLVHEFLGTNYVPETEGYP